MKNESIGAWQLSCIVFLFLMGSTVLNFSGKSGQDTWFAILVATVAAVPLILLFARLLKLHPGKNIYEITEAVFGTAAGKVVSVLYIWYAMQAGAMSLREVSEFASITALPSTPILILMLGTMLVVIHLVKSGGKILGRFSVLLLSVILIVFSGSFLLSLNNMNPQNLQPVLNHATADYLQSAWGFFANPLAESVLLLGMGNMVRRDVKQFRFWMVGVGLAVFCILLNLLRTIMVIGIPYMAETLFPQYIATRTIDIGEIVSRIEGLTSITLHLVSIVKITVCVYAVAFGLSHLFRFKNKNDSLVPGAMLVFMTGSVLYNNLMDILALLKIYQYSALPFQVIIPVIIWLGAEFKKNTNLPKQKRRSLGTQN